MNAIRPLEEKTDRGLPQPAGNDETAPLRSDKPARGIRPRQIAGGLLSFMLFLVGVVVLFTLVPMVQNEMLNLGLCIFLLMLGGVLPVLIYTSFVRNRLPTLFVEYKQNLRRLGFPENAELYQKKFEEIYGRTPDGSLEASSLWRQPLSLSESPIVVATLLSTFGWFVVFFPASDLTTISPNHSVLAYGFLGAYVFGLGALVRQYLRDDLQPRYYANLTLRFLTVFILSWLIGLAVDAINPQAANFEAYLLAAFVIGLFPSIGLLVIQQVGSKVLGMVFKGFQEPYPLSELDGLNAFQEDRLALEGIENLQNLSCANIVDLMLRTRYPVEQIVDWIDQSLLHLHTRKLVKAFQQSGYRTATDFLDAFNGLDQADQPTLQVWRERMAALILARLEEDDAKEMNEARLLTLMETTASALKYDPNLFHVQYWRRHEYEALPEDVDRLRTRADLKLMQGLPVEAIDAYDQVLARFPNSQTTRLYRGLAFYQLRDYRKAINEYLSAIEQSSLQQENIKTAFIELGRAYRDQGEVEIASQYYEKALKLDKESVEAHLDLAYLQMSRLGEYTQAIDHLNVAIERDFKKAEALGNRGLARFELWKRSVRTPLPVGASPETGLLDEARADLLQALRLDAELVPASLNLAIVFMEAGQTGEALNTLERLIRKLESEEGRPPLDADNAYRARLMRGNLYYNLGDYPAAAENYRMAARIAPYDAGAFYNLGVAYQQLARSDTQALDAALRAFREAIALKPGHAPAHQSLGDLLLVKKQFSEAQGSYETALRLSRERGDLKSQALARLSLGKLFRLTGRPAEARRELAQSGKLADEQNDDLTYTEATYELGLLELAGAQAETPPDPAKFERAASLLGTAAALFEAINLPRPGARAYFELAGARKGQAKTDETAKALTNAEKLLEEVFDPANAEDVQLKEAIEKAGA